METLQNIWNFIADFYNQNMLSIWIYIAIAANIIIIIDTIKIVRLSSINTNRNELIDVMKKRVSQLNRLHEINEKEISRLKDVISALNSKFVEIESDNLPKRDSLTGRFEKRL
jgi:hypothetical protein